MKGWVRELKIGSYYRTLGQLQRYCFVAAVILKTMSAAWFLFTFFARSSVLFDNELAFTDRF